MSIHHPIFARLYPKMAKAMERAIAGLCSWGSPARVIEVGAGDGLNFRHYPPTVTRVLAVEPEPHLWSLAHKRARAGTRGLARVQRVFDATLWPRISIER